MKITSLLDMIELRFWFTHQEKCPCCGRLFSIKVWSDCQHCAPMKIQWRWILVARSAFCVKRRYKPGDPFCLSRENDYQTGTKFCDWYDKQGSQLLRIPFSVHLLKDKWPDVLRRLKCFSVILRRRNQMVEQMQNCTDDLQMDKNKIGYAPIIISGDLYLYDDGDPGFENVVRLIEDAPGV